MSSSPAQLPLNFSTHQLASLEDYVVGDNKEALFQLFSPDNKVIYLWATGKLGKTHLLSSLIAEAFEKKQAAAFIPLSQKDSLDPMMLNNLEQNQLVCLDDIDAIAGNEDWEIALFHFYNKMKQANHKLVVSGHNNALNSNFDLPDLRSRLQWGLTYELKPLDDTEIIKVLQQRAQNQSFHLSHEVVLYLLNQVSRDLDTLIRLLEDLSTNSLSQHRKLTIPFVKSQLASRV